MRLSPFIVCFALCSHFSYVYSDECRPLPQLRIKTDDVFDLRDPDTIWLHRLANRFHIVTKPSAIENELAYLNEKCAIGQSDLKEAARNLRRLKYIKSAQVRQDNDDIYVETSDKWTLMPTLDFSRKGGRNTFSVGVKDRNLFGYGIDAEVGYFNDVQRSGYILDTNFPLYMQNNLHGAITLSQTDDGSTQGISVIKPFMSFDTTTAFSTSFYQGDLSQQYFLNGEDFYSLSFSDRAFLFDWGRKLYRDENAVVRYHTGVDYSSRDFTTTDVIDAPFQPRDRVYFVPYVQFDYIEDKYRELSNIHVINQIEDFNFGWQMTGKIGMNVSARNNDESRFVTELGASKGSQFGESTILLSNISVVSNFGSTATPRAALHILNEVFYRFKPKVGLYGAQRLTLSKNPFLDTPVVIGEENGVRGYPLEYQRGESTASFTGELRYYPNINIYNLFELGAAAYVDSGRAFNTQDFANENDGWLTSLGLGARFYSKHASDIKVIHLDMSFPLNKGENVDNVAFLLTTKSSF